MNLTPLQNNFSTGELAPDLQVRSTLEMQQRGVKTLQNFTPDPRGPVERRPGFRFLGKVGEDVPTEIVDLIVAVNGAFYLVDKDDRDDYSNKITNITGAINEVWVSEDLQKMYAAGPTVVLNPNNYYLSYSTNGGSTWTRYAWSLTVRGTDTSIGGPFYDYDNKRWLVYAEVRPALSYECWSSTDFINWTRIAQNLTGLTKLNTNATAVDKDEDGNWASAGNGNGDSCFTSSDGETWSESTNVDNEFNRAIFTYYENERWLYTGSRQSIFTAAKATPANVTRANFGGIATTYVHSVKYGDGVWLALTVNDSADRLFRSFDGINWSVLKDGTFNGGRAPHNLEYVPGYGFLVGSSASIPPFALARSTDQGVTWTPLTPTGFQDADVHCIYLKKRVHN